ncbi:hypothetical protein [Roseomonas sp. BN140053]|uniref:hypothetical protein n=1 Tax=Roseomonas sp. BN140053 TaxID=3391898 RepID=UPI0039EAD2F9
MVTPEAACAQVDTRLGLPPQSYMPGANTGSDQGFDVFVVPASVVPAFEDSMDEAVLQAVEQLTPVVRLLQIPYGWPERDQAACLAASRNLEMHDAALLVA